MLITNKNIDKILPFPCLPTNIYMNFTILLNSMNSNNCCRNVIANIDKGVFSEFFTMLSHWSGKNCSKLFLVVLINFLKSSQFLKEIWPRSFQFLWSSLTIFFFVKFEANFGDFSVFENFWRLARSSFVLLLVSRRKYNYLKSSSNWLIALTSQQFNTI